jgi:hypothetical protein
LFRINVTSSAIAWSFSLHNSVQFPTRAGSTQRIKEYGSRHAFPHENYASPNNQMHRSRKTDQGMQLQTSPQQLGTVPSRIYTTDQGMHFRTPKVCISNQSNVQIKENGSRHATSNIAPTTRNSSQRAQDLRNNSAQFPSRQNRSMHAFPNTTRMHLQTLKCTNQGIRIKDCNSKHCAYCTDQGYIKCNDQGIQIKGCISNTMLDSSCRSSKTWTPTETRTRGTVRSLPPHPATYVTFRELHSIPKVVPL